jgi:hypothetical protein
VAGHLEAFLRHAPIQLAARSSLSGLRLAAKINETIPMTIENHEAAAGSRPSPRNTKYRRGLVHQGLMGRLSLTAKARGVAQWRLMRGGLGIRAASNWTAQAEGRAETALERRGTRSSLQAAAAPWARLGVA